MAAAALAAAGAVPPARQAELHNLVVQDCGSCHGLTLKGGLGKPLLPADLEPFPDEVVAAVILDGVKGTPMPPWRGLLTEGEALWIARQLKQGIGR
ncbi:MAG: cytochrome c [Alphaproteobacteria bacterium]|nr:cytochrome c [Alphaproteobacteria bacterium]